MVRVLVTCVLATVAFAACGGAQVGVPAPAAAAGSEVAGYLGERAITAAEVDAAIKGQLKRLRQEEYDLRMEGLRTLAFQILQDQEAAKQGISRDELYKRNVTDKTAEPAKEEIDQILQRFRARLPEDDAAARQEVVNHLRERNAQTRLEAWKGELLAAAKLKVALEPPRTEIRVEANDPVVGATDAPVTIVEFTDFQCPYCQQAHTALGQVEAAYAGKLRRVFKQLPLPMHPQARLAAEASLCAADQGKFAAARDWLFTNKDKVTIEALKGWAAEVKLDEAAFTRCLDEHTHAKEVDEDLTYAAEIEVNSTPTFFVNGRLIAGARPADAFREVIDDELARAGAVAAPVAAVK